MLGRTPGNIVAIRPLRDGVISNFDITERLLRHFLKKVVGTRIFFKPRVVVCVPSGVTEVEKRSVIEATDLCDLTRHCEDALGSWQAEDAAARLQALAALLDTLEATLTQSAIRPPLTTPVARIATVDVTWNSGLLEKCWPGLSLLAFGHAGVGGAGVRDLLDRLERGMAEDRWPEQQAPFKQALADALTQRSSLDAALRANDPRAAHRASEALEDALTEMEDSLLAAGSGPKRKKPSFFRRLFGLR